MPQTINGFQVLRKIAETNTAEIFHVLRLVGRGRGDEYALKVLRPQYADDRGERTFLENEHRVRQGIEHPNLIRVHEVMLDAPRPFLVMELVHGRSLRDILARERPPLATGLGWLAQVADGLAAFHEHGCIHRDVKPQNIVVGEDHVVRVIDFALARAIESRGARAFLRRLFDRRRPGTWSYMAPEQIRNEPLTAQTDVYSLGVTVYETVTGKLPFGAETSQALLEQHLHASPPPMVRVVPDVPGELEELVLGMMAKDPLDRPHGMGYVGMKLRGIMQVCG